MRRSLGAVGVALVVAIPTLPAVAQAKPIPVDGDRFPSPSLVRKVMSCTSPVATPKKRPAFLIKRGPGNAPIGKYSAGWRPGSKGFGGAALTYIASPSTLSEMHVDVNTPATSAAATAAAIYQPPNDDGYWLGLARLTANGENGWRRVDGSGARYSWYHFTAAGVQDTTAAANPLQAHAGLMGGDGEGARVGFILGCDGNRVFFDRLKVSTSSDDAVYDFGGYRTRAGISLGSRGAARTTIDFGQKVKLGGRLVEQRTGDRIAGTLQFQAKPQGGKSWRLFARETTSKTRLATTRPSPRQHTAYRVYYAGTKDKYENAMSGLVKVLVRIKVNAGFVDRSIYKGDRWAVTGRVAPGKRTKVQLQRYVNGGWQKRGAKRTQRDGSFRFEGRADEIVVSHWRVRAFGGKKIGDGVSSAFKLRVEKRPPPDSGGGGGGGGGGGDTDPPPPPVDPPPPPPEG